MILWFKDHPNTFVNISLKWYDMFGDWATPDEIVTYLSLYGYKTDLIDKGWFPHSVSFGIETDEETALMILIKFGN